MPSIDSFQVDSGEVSRVSNASIIDALRVMEYQLSESEIRL